MIDHVTYEIPKGALDAPNLGAFFATLNLHEVKPSEEIEGKGWRVRWWEDENGRQVHLVESDHEIRSRFTLSHFCVTGVGRDLFNQLLDCEWTEHYTDGSERVWLAHPVGVRVEVRA